jgi:hypothetical protein
VAGLDEQRTCAFGIWRTLEEGGRFEEAPGSTATFGH